MTETQKKVDNMRIGKPISMISSMRDREDKRGGGLMILYREEEEFYFEKIENNYRDCLEVRGKIGKEEVNLIVIYLGTGSDREVLEKNREMLLYLMERKEEADRKEEIFMIIGDFNCHLGYLGYQQENENGKIVNKFIEETGILVLNVDERCRGVFTWERGESRSVIDLAMANERGYETFVDMEIDEKREKMDISDHCLIEIRVRTKMKKKKWKEWMESYYYSTKKEKMTKYAAEVDGKIREEGEITMKRINGIIEEAANEHLRTKYRKRIDTEGKEEPPWLTEDIRREIKERRTK